MPRQFSLHKQRSRPFLFVLFFSSWIVVNEKNNLVRVNLPSLLLPLFRSSCLSPISSVIISVSTNEHFFFSLGVVKCKGNFRWKTKHKRNTKLYLFKVCVCHFALLLGGAFLFFLVHRTTPYWQPREIEWDYIGIFFFRVHGTSFISVGISLK